MEPAIFERMPKQERFDLMPDVYVPLLRDGASLHTWLQPSGAEWTPVGSPLELLEANLIALARVGRHIDPSARVEGRLHGSVWIGAGATLERGAELGPNAVVSARASIGSGARLASALALPDAKVGANARLLRAVAFGSEVWRDG